MGLRLNAIAVLLLLSVAPASAYTINNINLIVDKDGTVRVEEKIIVSTGESQLRLTLPENHESLGVTKNGVPLHFEVEDSLEGPQVVALFDSSARSENIDVVYESTHLTAKSGGVWTLNFPARTDPYRTIVKVTLPRNTTVLDWSPKNRFTPTEDGLIVYPESEQYDFVLNYAVGGGDDDAEKPPKVAFLYIVLVVVAIVLLLVFRRFTRRPSDSGVSTTSAGIQVSAPSAKVEIATEDAEEKPGEASSSGEMKDSVYKILEDNERKIVDFLIAKHGEDITQAQICRETGIPKATLSDLMRRLEKRNVLERERQGRRNWVKLKKWVLR